MFIFHSRESNGGAFILDESDPALELQDFQVFRLTFDFFPCKFTACLKPPSRNNHRKALYPKTQQRDQGAGST